MPDGFDKLAEGVGKAIETMPNLYDDAFKPAVQESGKTLALVPRAINSALVPLRQWIAERENKLAETEKLLAQKLEYVSEEKIVTPDAYVAVPAIQAISYSMNSEELRNLYANLLAKAMNSDTKDMVHPSFVEIIKQLSPIDSKIFKEIGSTPSFPVVKITAIEYESIDNIQIYSNYKDSLAPSTKSFSFDKITSINLDYESVLTSIDNLLRLRLIKEEQFYYDALPSNITNTKVFEMIRSKIKQQITTQNWSYKELTYNITLTSLGQNFFDICVSSI